MLSVLILAVIGVAISTTLLLLSVSSAQTAATFDESQEAKNGAQACIEKAIQVLIATPTYTGSGSLSIVLGGQTCTYSVSQVNTSTNNIYATSTVGQTTRKLLVRMSKPQLVLLTWQEI